MLPEVTKLIKHTNEMLKKKKVPYRIFLNKNSEWVVKNTDSKKEDVIPFMPVISAEYEIRSKKAKAKKTAENVFQVFSLTHRKTNQKRLHLPEKTWIILHGLKIICLPEMVFSATTTAPL